MADLKKVTAAIDALEEAVYGRLAADETEEEEAEDTEKKAAEDKSDDSEDESEDASEEETEDKSDDDDDDDDDDDSDKEASVVDSGIRGLLHKSANLAESMEMWEERTGQTHPARADYLTMCAKIATALDAIAAEEDLDDDAAMKYLASINDAIDARFP